MTEYTVYIVDSAGRLQERIGFGLDGGEAYRIAQRLKAEGKQFVVIPDPRWATN